MVYRLLGSLMYSIKVSSRVGLYALTTAVYHPGSHPDMVSSSFHSTTTFVPGVLMALLLSGSPLSLLTCLVTVMSCWRSSKILGKVDRDVPFGTAEPLSSFLSWLEMEAFSRGRSAEVVAFVSLWYSLPGKWPYHLRRSFLFALWWRVLQLL